MDRKALIRKYKETPRPIGVFSVRNTRNGKALIGTSRDLPAVLNRHRAQLRLNAHRNREMQSDWNQHGPEVFEFEILDTLTPSDLPDYDPTNDLRQLEALWIEKLAAEGDLCY